jgi:mono/diheme cytochrome c family protein
MRIGAWGIRKMSNRICRRIMKASRPARRNWPIRLAAAALLAASLASNPGRAETGQRAEPVLVITDGTHEQRFTADQLSSRPDVTTVKTSGDVYHAAVTYRAIPLLALLGSGADPKFDTIETAARDGFASQIPLGLIKRGASDGAIGYLAIEDRAHPWPKLPGKTETAGPFYLIWDHPERSAVTREQWPYQVIRLAYVESPVHRWPQIAAPATLPADAPARHGQEVFVTQCLPCHRINGGGASDTGPDFGHPMYPTQFLTDAGLRALVRDPKSVRTWPEQRMIGFSRALISDADLDALMAYLHAMASAGCTGASCLKP